MSMTTPFVRGDRVTVTQPTVYAATGKPARPAVWTGTVTRVGTVWLIGKNDTTGAHWSVRRDVATIVRHASDADLAAAREAGAAAYNTGGPQAPGIDAVILDLLEGAPVGEPRTIDLMRAWWGGFDAARDRDSADVLAAILSGGQA